MWWLKKIEYDNKIVINISNLVETMWPTMYPWLIKIAHDQG